MLVRDVTELRRRDRQLMSKDATIREIHHRVKNNLQTVAALLRLQARRVESPRRADGAGGVGAPGRVDRAGARDAVGVAGRGGDFDEVVDRLLPMLADVTAPAARVRCARDGRVRVLPAEVATPLVAGADRAGAERGRARVRRTTASGTVDGRPRAAARRS